MFETSLMPAMQRFKIKTKDLVRRKDTVFLGNEYRVMMFMALHVQIVIFSLQLGHCGGG